VPHCLLKFSKETFMYKRFLVLSYVSLLIVSSLLATMDEKTANKLQSIIRFCDQSTKSEEDFVKYQQLLDEVIFEVMPQERRVHELRKQVQEAQAEIIDRITTKPIPTLSFIIPAYNRERVIGDSLDSIYNQHLTIPFEVVVVDDASTDNTVKILEKYSKKYDNFFYHKNSRNMRAPATRNRAIAYARGEYICNVDCDDILSPDCIMPMLTSMRQHGCDAAYFDRLCFFEGYDRNKIHDKSKSTEDIFIDIHNILRTPSLGICAGNRLFTKKAWLSVGGYLQERGHDSWSFSFLLAANEFKAYVHPGSWYWHRTWAEENNMFRNDQREKVNDISPKQVVFEHDFLFIAASVDKLINSVIVDGDFIATAGKILKLQNKPVNNAKILLKTAYLQFTNKNTDAAKTALANYIKNLKK